MEKKRLIIVISILVAALLIAIIPIVMFLVGDDDKGGNPPEVPDDVFEGTYVLAYPTGSDTYIFKEGNKVTVKTAYLKNGDLDENNNPGDDYEIKETNYTYEIVAIDGKNYIVLTNEETGEKEPAYEFAFGHNDWYRYFCENEHCLINNSGKGTDESGIKDKVTDDGHCTTHFDCKVELKTVKQRFIEVAGEMYQKVN